MSASGSLWRRVLALTIDALVVPLVSFMVMLVSGAMEHAQAYAGIQPLLRPVLLGIVGYLLVNGWWLASSGQTLGKKILGLKIVQTNNTHKPPLWKLICIRGPFFVLVYAPLAVLTLGWSLAGVGIAAAAVINLIPALGKDRRCLHDLLAGTVVVKQ